MGIWGPGNFENDDVMDWLTELTQSDSSDVLDATLREVIESDPHWIEAPECCRALGAAEVVAALRNAPHPGLPKAAAMWVATHQATTHVALPALALASLTRVRGDSELRALWSDEGQLAIWLVALDDLARRLGGVMRHRG